jgi:sugar phosphate isomerase/epimerase
MYKFGLKLWSTNENYVADAVRLYNEGFYHYVELYIIPDSFNKCINLWTNLDIPYIIHAPHFRNGMNLAKKEYFDINMKLAEETKKFADELNANIIIYHPGIAGDLEETVRQLNIINDNRIIIENKPYYTVLNDGNICNGHSHEEIKYILDNTNTGFCLDIGHCFCSANAKKIEPMEYLRQFLTLNPKLFHLTDNDYNSPIDKHYHFGQGNFNVKKIFSVLPSDVSITIETNKDFKDNLSDFEKDINCLNEGFYN